MAMIMTSRLRKFALTAHLTVLVGWLGAAAAYLALAVVGLTTQDSEMASAAYRAMEVVGFAIIVPCSVAALLLEPWWTLAAVAVVYLALMPLGYVRYARIRRQREARKAPTLFESPSLPE